MERGMGVRVCKCVDAPTIKNDDCNCRIDIPVAQKNYTVGGVC